MLQPISRRLLVLLSCLAGLAAMDVAGSASLPQEREPTRHDITITSRNYEFSPPRIEVRQGDVVRITLTAEDIPHSFTIDEYRIAKRAAPSHPVTFEFRADRPGTFVYYCNLTIDDGCRQMRGELVVLAR